MVPQVNVAIMGGVKSKNAVRADWKTRRIKMLHQKQKKLLGRNPTRFE
jgi:hypothetical protein